MLRQPLTRRPPRSGRTRLRGRDILTPFVLLAALLSMGMVGYGQFQTSHVIEHQTRVLPVAGEVAQRVATSQLFLVRALAGDETVSVQEQVFQPLHATQDLIDDALKGDAADGALVAAARDSVIREDLKRLRALVNSFAALSSSRWNNRTRPRHDPHGGRCAIRRPVRADPRPDRDASGLLALMFFDGDTAS